jgi:dehydrogenase/reductase SDR family member 7B
LTGKTVIITGASSGIGKACAFRFARAGFDVVITGRNSDTLLLVENDLKKIHPRILSIVSDVSLEIDCERIINETLNSFGRINVLINNAGISMRALFENTRLDVLKKIMDINFWGTVYCSHYALPHLLKTKGSLVGISSIAGKKGLPGRTGYSASKFAVEGFLETVRTENLKKDLHVLVACPGFTASGIRNSALNGDGQAQKESPRSETAMMTAEEVAEHIYNAVISRKRDLVLTFQGKFTLWLNKFAPAFVDRLVYNHMAKETDSPFK